MKAKVTQLDVSEVFGEHEPIHKVECGTLTVWKYKDLLLAANLFALHDQQGFPLSESLRQCKRFNLIPCIDQFRHDASRAGWSKEKIERTIQEAEIDSLSWSTAT